MSVKLSIIIPCFNEVENAKTWDKSLFPRLNSLDCEWEAIFVDDASEDNTAGALEQFSKQYPRAKIIKHKKNNGLGASLTDGIKAAEGEYITALDADLSFKPEDIKKLLNEIQKTDSDCVCGSPFLGQFENIKLPRKVLSVLINKLLGRLFFNEITAYTQIFKIYRAEKIKKLNLMETGFTINAEILIGLKKSNADIREIGVVMRRRKNGKSKIRILKEIFNYFRLIARKKF